MEIARQRSYWEANWDKKHHMPSWAGAKFSKEDYVDYCVRHYVEVDKNVLSKKDFVGARKIKLPGRPIKEKK